MGHKSQEASSSEASASEASESSSSESSSSETSKKSKAKSKSKEKKKSKDKKSKKSKKEKKSKDKKEKKSKSSKSTKRGPKGAQWTTWKIPFQEKSILGQSFEQAAKKGGVDEKKLSHFIKKNKGTPAFILRILKRGYNRGWKWEVDDSHGRLRVLHAKIDKKYRKAA